MSHRDAAAVLGLTPKAVEVRVYRAKRAVARELGIPEGG
jgi:DNA-directed RNA polymerase specialized sigma24 family protein